MKPFDQIDFLILAPLELEIEALQEVFDNASIAQSHSTEFCDYRLRGKDEDLCIRVLQLPRPGVLRAGITTTERLIQWKPRYIVSFGITAGFTESGDVNLEDVVVAEGVFYYEPAKEAGRTTKLRPTRGQRPKTRKRNKETSRQARPDPILTAEEFPLQVERFFRNDKTILPGRRVRTGYLASGEKLIDDSDSTSRKAIKDINDKILGCEQEAAGVGAACHWTYVFPKPGFVVVKGVSDDAKHKGALNRSRKPAAMNAALILLKLLQTTKLYVRRDASLPEDVQGVLGLAKNIETAIGQFLAQPPDLPSLTNALYSMETLPHVFYHWEVRHDYIHWVDFHHLLLLRKLKDLDLVPYILLTEFRDVDNAEERLNLEKTIRAILGDDVSIKWYSELNSLRSQYSDYARSLGFDDAVRTYLRSANHALGLRGNIITEEWLQFMVWTVRETRRCLVLKWQRHAPLVAMLKKLNFMQVAILLTPDLLLGDALGKFDLPSVDLVINHPKYETVLSWLNSAPDPLHVKELARHLSLGEISDGELIDRAKELVPNSGILKKQLAGSEDVARPIRALLNTLGTWNERYFDSDT